MNFNFYYDSFTLVFITKVRLTCSSLKTSVKPSSCLSSFHPFSLCSIETGESPVSGGPAAAMDQPHVIPSQGDLLGDLLNLDLGPPVNVPQVSSMQMGAVDLLGGGLDSLVSLHAHSTAPVNYIYTRNLTSHLILTIVC